MVRSSPNKGTAIRVLLPVAPAGEAAALHGSAASDVRSSAPAESYQGTVLVVDDEEIVRSVSRDMLTALGLTVLTAEDGERALEIFRHEGGHIDCVLLDLSMPKMDGMAVCREMLRLRPDAKIILSSGYHEQEIIKRGSQEGLSGFIPKPYTLDAMQAVLDPVLKKGI